MEANKKSISVMVGAVAAAVGASLCCTLPIVASLIGIGLFTGASAFFEGIRPYFLGGAGIFLVAGYYFAFRKRAVPDCECEPGVVGKDSALSGRNRRNPLRIALLVATVAVLFFGALPTILTINRSGATAQTLVAQKVVVMRIEGMTCGGCVTAVEKALRSVTGVRDVQVSLKDKEARVGVNPSAHVTEAMLRAAVDKAGYRAFDFRWEE